MTTVFDHNQNPPKRLPSKGSATIAKAIIAWGENTPDEQLAPLGLYRQGENDPIPEGHQLVSQERVIRDGRSVLARVTEPAPVVEPQLASFPNGITSPRLETTEPFAGVVLHDEAGNKYTIAPVEGVAVLQQISSSPERDRAEIAARLGKVRTKLQVAKAATGKGNLQSRIEALESFVAALAGDDLSEPATTDAIRRS